MHRFLAIVVITILALIPSIVSADVTYRDSPLLNPLTVSTASRADVPHREFRPIWISASTVYFINFTGSVITIYKSVDAGVTWVSVGTVVSGLSGTFGATAYWDGWTPNDTGTSIHIIWNTISLTTSTLSYRRFDTATDTFPASAVNIVATSDANSSQSSPQRNYVELTKQNGNIYAMMYYRTSIDFKRSIDNGATWSSSLSETDICPNALTNGRSRLVFDPTDTDSLWLFCKTSATNLSFRSYTISSDTWSVVQDETVNAATSNYYQPVDITICRSDIYVVANGNEGILHSSNHAEFFRVTGTGITVIGDSLPGSTSRFYGGASSIVCNGNNNTLFQFVSWKPTALDGSATYTDNTTYPYQYYVRHRIAPFGGWSSFIAINEPTQDAPVYLIDGTANLNPLRVMTQLMVEQGNSERVLPIWRVLPAGTEWIVNYNKSLVLAPASVPITPDTDAFADALKNMLSYIGLVDFYGYLLFAVATTIALAVILLLVHVPFMLNGICCAIWFSGVIMTLASLFAGIAFAILLVALAVAVLVIIAKLRGSGEATE